MQVRTALTRARESRGAFSFLGFTTALGPSSLRPLRRSGAHADVEWKEGIPVNVARTSTPFEPACP